MVTFYGSTMYRYIDRNPSKSITSIGVVSVKCSLAIPILATKSLRMTSRLRELVVALILLSSCRTIRGFFSPRQRIGWLLVLLFSSGIIHHVASATRTDSVGGCSTVYLAKSSIPGAGWGVFAARDYEVGDVIVSIVLGIYWFSVVTVASPGLLLSWN